MPRNENTGQKLVPDKRLPSFFEQRWSKSKFTPKLTCCQRPARAVSAPGETQDSRWRSRQGRRLRTENIAIPRFDCSRKSISPIAAWRWNQIKHWPPLRCKSAETEPQRRQHGLLLHNDLRKPLSLRLPRHEKHRFKTEPQRQSISKPISGHKSIRPTPSQEKVVASHQPQRRQSQTSNSRYLQFNQSYEQIGCKEMKHNIYRMTFFIYENRI